MGLPVIGESIEFLWSGWKGHPEEFIYQRMTKYSSKVFKTSIIGKRTVMFCGAACNKFLFSNENKLVMSWWPDNVNKIFPSSLQTNMLPQFLSAQALRRYIAIMDSIAIRHFASEWENRTHVTVFPLAKRYTFWVACRLFINVDDPKQVAKMAEPFNKVASGIISMPIDLPGTPFNRAIKASKFIREELLMNIIKQRKLDLANGMATHSQDILSHMLVSCDENGQYITEHYIADKILGMLIGGHDTASSACTFIVKYLADLPHIYQNVYQEQMAIANSKAPGELLNWHDIEKMKYSWNVACEVMRLTPPFQGAFREAISDFIFNGFSIPKGWKLYWSASSTHKNPECFKDPEKFDPSRFEGNGPAPYTYVPFGGGPRMCPGKEYARMEILVFIHNLVKRFKWETVIPNENIIIDPMPVPSKGLPVRLYPHQSCKDNLHLEDSSTNVKLLYLCIIVAIIQLVLNYLVISNVVLMLFSDLIVVIPFLFVGFLLLLFYVLISNVYAMKENVMCLWD